MGGKPGTAATSAIHFNICNKYGMLIGDGLTNPIIHCKWLCISYNHTTFLCQGMHLCIGIIQFRCLFNGFCPQFVWICFSGVRSKVFRLLSKLKCFTAFFCGCKSALNVLTIVRLTYISPYCSLFAPARVIVLATKITCVFLKMKKIVNNNCTCHLIIIMIGHNNWPFRSSSKIAYLNAIS